jgi:hypothetical protein
MALAECRFKAEGSAMTVRKAKQELKRAVEFRAELMRQIDGQNFAFDA